MSHSSGAHLDDTPRADHRTTEDVVRTVLGSFWLWAALFLISRATIYHVWAEKYRFIFNDVKYYYYWLMQPNLGWDRLQEYPLPVLWVLGLIAAPAPTQDDYVVIFGVTMAVLDAVFAWLLFKRGKLTALAFWIAFVTGFGALIWLRYDMVPALVVGLAALWVAKHPERSGALVAFGASLKLWPALLIAPLIGRHRAGRQRMIAFGVTGFLLALLALIAGGPKRLVSPLTWQGDRGLQIESVPATLLMWRHSGPDGGRWDVHMSPYNAYEIFGPGVAFWTRAATLAMAIAVISAVAMAAVVWFRRALPADVLILAMVSIVAGMLVANKTFSPQYLVWLGTPVAALISEAKRPATRVLAAVLGITLVPMAWFTYRIYPVQYAGITANPIASREDISVLVARNLLLVVVALITTVGAWALLLQRHPEPHHPRRDLTDVTVRPADTHPTPQSPKVEPLVAGSTEETEVASVALAADDRAADGPGSRDRATHGHVSLGQESDVPGTPQEPAGRPETSAREPGHGRRSSTPPSL